MKKQVLQHYRCITEWPPRWLFDKMVRLSGDEKARIGDRTKYNGLKKLERFLNIGTDTE